MSLLKLLQVLEADPDPTHMDGDLLVEDSEALCPWQGVVLGVVIGMVIIIFGIIPWCWGVAEIIKRIF